MQATSQTHEQHALISNHIVLARKVARSIARRVPRSVEHDDLEGVAMVALTEAAQRYDAAHQATFQAYAACRIRGAVLDELRRRDPLGRRERQRVKQGEEQGVKLPTIRIESLDAEGALEPAGQDRPVDEEVFQRSRLSALQTAIEALPDRMQQILSLYFAEGRSQAEIGAELGVTESRVCQIRGEALRRLRRQLAH